MAFDVYTITNTGAQFLAQAEAGNRLVITGCGVNDEIYTLEEALELDAFLGELFSEKANFIGVDRSHVVFRASFPASNVYGGDHNSLLLYGHLESDTSGINYIIAVASATEKFHIPTLADTITVFECLFTLQYSANANAFTTQTSALEASKAEFDVLENRTLTTHQKWSETIGDTQTVYGFKTFKNGILVEGGFEVESMTANTIKPQSGQVLTLGDSTTTVEIDGSWFYANDAQFNTISVSDSAFTAQNDKAIFQVDVEMYTNLTLSGALIPDGSGTSIGTYQNAVPNIYATSLSTTNASISTITNSPSFEGDISLKGALVPTSTGESSIGRSLSRIKKVYATNADIQDLTVKDATLPASNGSVFPRGCIAFIQIPGTVGQLNFGDTFTNTSTHYIVAFDGTPGSKTIPTNSVWRLLSEACTLNNSVCALCMRTL